MKFFCDLDESTPYELNFKVIIHKIYFIQPYDELKI